MKIGFIGLGIMGKPMAKNLIKAGHSLVVYDINSDSVKEMVAKGARACSSSKDVAIQSTIIITMLPNSPHVIDVVTSESGILAGAGEGTILIDMSSIAPLASKDIAGKCAEVGVRMLDAPVSGGEPKAIDGTLSIMVGGDKNLFLQVKDEILLKMGGTAIYCGGHGSGNTTKLANQVVVACNIAACAEAFTLAKRAEVAPALVLDALRDGLAGSTVMNAKVPMMLDGKFDPGFRIDLHIKDLNNALETAHGVGAPLPLTVMIMEMLQTLHADGYGQLDHSGLAKYYAKLSSTKLWE